jgi:hypothetical protein
MIEAVLESLKNMPVVGMVLSHVFGDARNEVEKTKLTDDCGPKDEFEKIKSFENVSLKIINSQKFGPRDTV